MKILIVHSSAELYGSDRCMLGMVTGMIARGHEVHVAVPFTGILVDELKKAGARVHILETVVFRRDMFSVRGIARMLVTVPGAVRRLRGLIKQERIDLVHTNTGVTVGGALAARLSGRPHIWHFREILSEFGGLLRFYEKLLSALTTRAIFITAAVRDQFHSRRLKGRGIIVHDGIDFEAFAEVAPEKTDQKLNVTMVGRLAPYKGQDVLLRALAEIARQGIEYEACIVGDVYGERHTVRQGLMVLAEELGIAASVNFVGFQQDIRPYLERCNLFVMPSLRDEGLGVVMLEAMAAGRAVIASNGGGVREIIEDGVNGMLFEPGDSEALSKAIAGLARDAIRRKELAERGRRDVAARFTETAMVNDVIALYADTLQHRRRGQTVNTRENRSN